MIRELERHGYSLSPGTLYPILHGLKRDGFLQSQRRMVEGKIRRHYKITSAGRNALGEAMNRAHALMDELNKE